MKTVRQQLLYLRRTLRAGYRKIEAVAVINFPHAGSGSPDRHIIKAGKPLRVQRCVFNPDTELVRKCPDIE